MTGYEVVNFRGLKALGIPYSRTQIWRMMKKGKFPECFKLSDFRNSPPVWYLCEVIGWIETKAKGRRSK